MTQGQNNLKTDGEGSLPDTMISLIIAFVIAMSFRGFVLEGFVIPTGSMAPTLLGDHTLFRSPDTGYEFAVDTSRQVLERGFRSRFEVVDPMLGEGWVAEVVEETDLIRRSRPGDRVLVMKWLYSFFDPNRWDVLVFKNPAPQHGARVDENYIKRLIGLPNEEIWLADGDVFARPAGSSQVFRIERKPPHVQEAVWQPVDDTAYQALNDEAKAVRSPWRGEGWTRDGAGRFGAAGTSPLTLAWDGRIRPLDDWNVYNIFHRESDLFPVSDLRIRTAIEAGAPGLLTTLRLRARSQLFEFVLEGDAARIRMTPVDPDGRPVGRPIEATGTFRGFAPGRTVDVEFVHVDQILSIVIEGDEVATLPYEWSAKERLQQATGIDVDEVLDESRALNPWKREVTPQRPQIEWEFAGAPLTIHRIRVDRDLYYQPDILDDGSGPAVGTHPERVAVLGPDQFFMCGDNSGASHDSRKWGAPSRLIAEQIDPTAFVVNRKLIVGKAWCVYFPSPYGLTEDGARFVPDFGRVRFIR